MSNDNRMFFYVVDWLPPDFGAVGQYAIIDAREIARGGYKVCLIGLTSGACSTHRELFGHTGVLEIKRLPTKRYNKSGLVTRLIWSLRMNYRLIWEVIKDSGANDAEVLFTGAPPLMLFFAVFVKWFRGARLIYRITDFYPEVLIANLGRRPLPLAVFERITWFLRKQVDAIQALGEDQRRLLIDGGIAPERITIKRYASPVRFSGIVGAAPHPVELKGLKVLLYSGNYGVAHEVDTVVKGIIRHHRIGSGRFGLWLNALGSSVDAIVKQLCAAAIPFARTEPVALDQLESLLLAADAHLIALRLGFAGVVLPSKVYACLESTRPILYVGPRSSDVHLLCTEAKRTVYEHVEPGDVTRFAEALERLAQIA
jgi:hypothetical protein